MQSAKRLANRRAAVDAWASAPHAFEESHDCRRAARDPAERAAMSIPYRLRAIKSVTGQMLHEPKEKRQVSFVDPLFIEREDEIASIGMQKIIGILNPFGNSFQGKNVAQIIAGKKASEVRLADFGIDSHDVSARLNARAAGPRRALVLATPMREVKRPPAIALGLSARRALSVRK